MYNRIKKIEECLKKENEESKLYLDKKAIEKYDIFKKWLEDNGAEFKNNIDFPFTYGPFHEIGCKCISNINENEAVFLIPRSLLIINEDLHYIDKYIQSISESLEENETDMSIIYLVLNLYLEKQNPNSFYKPYIDIIYLNYNNTSEWDEKNLTGLNDEYLQNSIETILDSINELYNLIKICPKFSSMSKEEFNFCYFEILKRRIKFSDNIYSLVPLLDIVKNNQFVNMRYEIYDSENMVFKYTLQLTQKKMSTILFTTKSNNFKLPVNKPTYNKLLPIVNEEEDENDEEISNKILKINNNDYFCLSNSIKQFYSKGEQLFSFSNAICNKKLIKNNRNCLLYNLNDYTNLRFQFNRGDLLNDKYLEMAFKEKYKTKNNDPLYNILKIKVEFNNVSVDLIKYYRFMFFYDIKKKTKEFFNYHFDYELEVSLIGLAINYLKDKIKSMEQIFEFEKDLNEIEYEIFKNKNPNKMKANILVYRVTQKINLMNQVNLLEFILSLMKKYKNNVKGYNDLIDYIGEFSGISQFDTDENNKMKVLRFIAIISKNID